MVDDALGLEIGGRRFELLHTPSESTYRLSVWLPDERIASTGDLYGPSFANLCTLREAVRHVHHETVRGRQIGDNTRLEYRPASGSARASARCARRLR